MSKYSIDVAQETTLRKVLSKVEEGAGFWCKPEYIESSDGIGGIYTDAGYWGADEGNAVINFQNKLCLIPDNSIEIITPGGMGASWWHVCTLPFRIDIHETSIIVFNNEIHLLGGDNERMRSHYKYDGTRWMIASELPYNFCNGKVVVYQNKLHILGGGSTDFGPSYEGRLNNHYAWDGETWEKASDLPYPVWGCTPIVCKGKLHIIGGNTVNGTNYNKTHYIWDGISWSKGTDLPFTSFNGSAVNLSDDQVYVTAGMDQYAGTKLNDIKLFNGSSWSTVANLPNDALNNSGAAISIDGDRNIAVCGKRLFTMINGSYVGHMATPGLVDKGDIVIYRGEVHLFCNRNHFKWISTGWEKLSAIPYNFNGGSAVVYDDKINLLGSSSSGVEDYHYTWCPEDGWKVKSNLPEKFSNGSAVVLNNEIHIIGGTKMNSEPYNHYKLVDARWEVVSHTIGSVIGPKCAVEHDGLIYAATQVDDNNSTISACNITVFDGVGWKSIGTIDTKVSANNYRYLVVFQNRIHLMIYTPSDGLLHYALTGLKTTIGHAVQHTNIPVTSVPCVLMYSNRIYTFSSPKPDQSSIVHTQYAISKVPLLKIYLPKEHQIICDKTELLPVIGEVEETESGYKALTTGLYTFVNYATKFSVC